MKAGLHLSVNCEVCGAVYRQSRSDQVFCSGRCSSAAWRARRPRVVNCVTCGKPIKADSPGVKYCGDPCSSEAARSVARRAANGDVGKGWSAGKEYVPRTPCQECGALFYAPPVQRRRGGGRYCSVRCRTAVRARSPESFPTPRSRGGKRADLDGRYFRSTWEANWARYLNWLMSIGEIKAWDFECDTFEFTAIKRGSRFYVPDFKVTNKNGSVEYHEIKGYMDQRSATKLKRMKRYHPQVRLVLVDKPAYMAVARKLSSMLPGWETTPGRRN